MRHLLKSFEGLGFCHVKLVMDRGFYSADNINALYQADIPFLISPRMSLKRVRNALETVYEGFRSFESFQEDNELYTRTVETTWALTPVSGAGNRVASPQRLYLHYDFNLDQAVEDEKAFNRWLIALRSALLSGQRRPDHEKLYAAYFDIHTASRKVDVTVKEEAVKQATRYDGFFALMTNQAMSSRDALAIYRNKDLVEKAFGNLKERLNLRRMLVSSEQSLDGKLFVAFVALIYLSHLKKKMQETALFKTYSISTLLDKLDVIERFEVPGAIPYIGEILNAQKAIYLALGVPPPTSL